MKDFTDKANRYLKERLPRLLTILGYVVGGIGLAFFLYADGEHKQHREDDLRLYRLIDEKTGETDRIKDILQAIETDLTKQQIRAELKNDKERTAEIQKLLDGLDRNQRLIKK